MRVVDRARRQGHRDGSDEICGAVFLLASIRKCEFERNIQDISEGEKGEKLLRLFDIRRLVFGVSTWGILKEHYDICSDSVYDITLEFILHTYSTSS